MQVREMEDKQPIAASPAGSPLRGKHLAGSISPYCQLLSYSSVFHSGFFCNSCIKNKLARALSNCFPACNIALSTGPSVSKRAESQASDGSDLDQSFQDDQESDHCFPSVLCFNCRLLLTSLTCRSISLSLFLQNRGLPVRFLFSSSLRT